MVRSTFPLDDIRVATPCQASWANMEGDERARFCHLCHKNVYNLSALSADEARTLIEEKEGKLCVRFYQREDGTVMTEDCPVGLRAFRRRVFGVGTIAVGILVGVLGLAWATTLGVREHGRAPASEPSLGWNRLMNWLFGKQTPPPRMPVVMGKICPK